MMGQVAHPEPTPVRYRYGVMVVAGSLLGLAIHNTLELGAASLLDFASGFIPMLVIEGALLIIWTQAGSPRRIASAALLGMGLLHLIGGAILSVLPLEFLPFVPEQSLAHYAAHGVYGLLQIPLIVFSAKHIRKV
jgi:hypothetical protein